MFTIRENHTFKRKVTVNVPNDKGGFSAESFMAEFKAVDQDEARRLYESMNEESRDQNVLAEVFIGFENVKDPDGNSIEYSDQVRDQLMKIPYVSIPLISAFWQGLAGQKVKN